MAEKRSASFYVYEHWRPDTGQCFYVGKGQKFRSRRISGRNPHHANIVAKLRRAGLKVEIRIVKSLLSENDAFALEKERIAHWLSEGMHLANRTTGGEGVSNPPSEVRAAIAKALTGNKHSLGVKRSQDEKRAISARMAGNQIWLGREFTESHRSSLSLALKGRPGRKKSQQEIEKIRSALRLRVRTPETCKKLSETVRASWAIRKLKYAATNGRCK